ncbi:MAG TPA: LytTR family DNA-binding domain-containing protein [Puia sp.]|jgi:DNA-binding LytR/AlgR family response regulator|nr:LytTR family DNA-binding domain-containing protein [Puia sp.]
MLLKAIIVDDEPIARKVLSEYIEDIDYLELAGMAENPLKADALIAVRPVDLIFLDINMPKLSGIEFLRARAAGEKRPLVIITTAYAEYALDGFELDVVDYLLKPISFERCVKACHKARLKYAERLPGPATAATAAHEDHFFVKCDDGLEKVAYNELLFVEAMMNYVVLHTAGRKLIVYLTLKSILSQLPAQRFIQVHKSFVVNKDSITGIRGNTIRMGAISIPISQHFHETAMREIVKDRIIKRN